MRAPAHLLTLLACLVACSSDAPVEPPTTEPPPPSGGAFIRHEGIPDGWGAGVNGPGYTLGIQMGGARSGDAAMYIAAIVAGHSGNAQIVQQVKAEDYRGRRLRLTGWLRPTAVTGVGAVLWMRVDGRDAVLAFDNMVPARPVTGTSGWQEVSVVLDVPDDAIGVAFGALLIDDGTVLVDDLRLEVVDASVPSTNVLDGPVPRAAGVANTYELMPRAPLNLGFEGVPPHPAATIDWLRGNMAWLNSSQPGTGLDDLEPLRAMVGDARIVALGEGTHGTREFFQMKHRMLEFLVTRMGFTQFAMETSWAEARALDEYVTTGKGDPSFLLARLGFWTWNTDEVFEMIRWMRQWNQTAPPDRQVRFHGFDPQLMSAAAVDMIRAAAMRVSVDDDHFVAQRTDCIVPYVGSGLGSYEQQPSAFRETCARTLAETAAWVEEHRAAIEATSPPGEYPYVLQSARVLQQLVHMLDPEAPAIARDSMMAVNVDWLAAQAPPGARIVLWAHNAHVARQRGMMGHYLRNSWGDDYVNAGFVFGRGRFNAVMLPTGGLRPVEAAAVLPHSIEAAFLATGVATALLDLRLLEGGGDATMQLRSLIPMRSIGSIFYPAAEKGYFAWTNMREQYDLLVYVNSSTPTSLR